ncbi:hypothetical protein D3C78_1872110 [compost metagenome]
MDQRAEHSPSEAPCQPGGKLHQPQVAALALLGPVWRAHRRHRRQRIAGARSSMPKNSLACIFEINALSCTRRKCDRPSCG